MAARQSLTTLLHPVLPHPASTHTFTSPCRPPSPNHQVCKAYFALVDMLCASHVPLLAARDTPTFVFLLSSLDAGLKSLDVAVSSQCAAAIDNLAGYYFLHMPGGHSPNAAARAISEHVRQRPDLFPQLLTTLFEIVMFEDCSNMWSLSRPMLSLILVSEQVLRRGGVELGGRGQGDLGR